MKYKSFVLLALFLFSCEKKEEYTLFINIQPENTGLTNPLSGQKFEEGTSVDLSATPNRNYKFSNWSGDITGIQNPTVVEMDADKNITANFEKLKFSLNITILGNGKVEEKIIAQKVTDYEIGTKIRLTAIPDGGNIFLNWFGDTTGNINPIS